MKHICFAMALAACVCLTGCKGKSGQQTGGDNDTTTANTEIEEQLDEAVENELTQAVPYLELAQNFKVKGTPCVQSFVEALPIYSEEYGWDIDPEIDNKNGYFHFSQEGDGGVSYNGCVWKRDDGKRLFIFSYRQTGWNEYEGRTARFTRHSGSPWYYSSTEVWMTGENEDQISFYDYDTGFAAYLYNEETHTLELLPEPPINGWQSKAAHRQLLLPQKGKDIEVAEGIDEDSVYYTLKWNGMTFDL